MSGVRRRAGWLAAGLLLLSTVLTAREGAASGPWHWVEPPGPPMMGDPDEPNLHRSSGLRVGGTLILTTESRPMIIGATTLPLPRILILRGLESRTSIRKVRR